MAITATVTRADGVLQNATLRISRIWGSKEEGWNAWVNVFQNSTAKVPLETFSVNTPYVEGDNPFVSLYKCIGELSFVSDVVHDVSQEQPKDVVKVEIPLEEVQETNEEPKTRKSRKKSA